MVKSVCVFCKIVSKAFSCDLVYEDEVFMAFSDINPKYPIHILVVPKRHCVKLSDLCRDRVACDGDLFQFVQQVENKCAEGIHGGFRLICNMGPDAGQEIEHLHFHLISGQKLPNI